jgi:orotidine-5'-phosphate decarboxylase
MTFSEMLRQAWAQQNSLVCVGLDPALEKIPASLRKKKHPLFEFNKQIVDATCDLVCAYKPQIAYYSAGRYEADLEMTILYIHEKNPNVPVILDAKRGDIGSTAALYAKEAFDRYQADAVTVNPYMGGDSLQPFLERSDKGVVILCRTSNPGSADLQNLQVAKRPMYEIVAEKAASQWNKNNNLALVMGATYPKELKRIRSLVKHLPFLTPGIGAQGGDVGKAVRAGQTPDGTGMIINSSRGIIHAGNGPDFANAARQAALLLRDEINRYRKNTKSD